eukprot:scaffold55260_cov69-Phaeocystis_antarctica.AAC.3
MALLYIITWVLCVCAVRGTHKTHITRAGIKSETRAILSGKARSGSGEWWMTVPIKRKAVKP